MTSPAYRDKHFVEKAVSEITAVRPAYLSLIAFYGPVFVAQADAFAQTDPPPIPVDEADMAARRAAGRALITPAMFSVDAPAAARLLQRVCRIAADTGEKLADTGRALDQAMAGGLDVAPYLAETHRTAALAETLDVPRDMLDLLFHLACQPSITVGARKLSAGLAEEPAARPDCPVCGSSPAIGELDGNGAQWLHCRLCRHRWPIRRIICPACGSNDADVLGYLYSEQEAEYRVSLCDGCKHYLKVVDTRKMNRPFFPPLEQVVTLHLDMLVTEKGYTAVQ